MSLEIYQIPEVKMALISPNDYELLCRENPKSYKNTELFEGVIIEKMTKSSEHIFWKHLLSNSILKIMPQEFFLRNKDVILIGNSELEPDISVVVGNFLDYRNNFPTTARLVVEISISSLQYELEKARSYALGKVEEYWIIDCKNQQIEIYTQPSEKEYLHKKILPFSEPIPLFDSTISIKTS